MCFFGVLFNYLKKIPPYIYNIIFAIEAVYLAYSFLIDFIKHYDFVIMLWFLIHFITAILFLTRKPNKGISSNIFVHIVSIASVMYFYLFDWKTDIHIIPDIIKLIVVSVGGILTILSLLSLYKSFGVLVSYREIRTKYMYKFIRHPIYLSYIVMDCGVVLAYFNLINAIVFVIAIGLFLLRIYYEESFLSNYGEYIEYKKRVRYRLIPFIY
jgi:protein-S-isoprenylcysteine O-methyltransferase Ste14